MSLYDWALFSTMPFESIQVNQKCVFIADEQYYFSCNNVDILYFCLILIFFVVAFTKKYFLSIIQDGKSYTILEF